MAPGLRRSRSSQSAQLSSGSNESNMGSTGESQKEKTVRKKARNLTLKNFTDRGGPKPKVFIPFGKLRPVGPWAKEFGSELGIICRKNIPLTCHCWKDVKKDYMPALYRKVEDKFDIDAGQTEVKDVIDDCLKNRFKQRRHELYQHYLGIADGLNKREYPESTVKQEEWESLCTHFESEKFQMKSLKNRENRKKQKIPHRGGRKPFVNHRYDQRDAVTGLEPDQIQFYQNMRWSADKGWTAPEARENYEKMVDLRSEPVKEGDAPLTDAEIAVKVLGKRSGYVKGLGYGEMPPARQAKAAYYGEAVNQLQTTTEEQNREIIRLRDLLKTQHEQSVAQQQLLEAQAKKQEEQDRILNALREKFNL